MSEPPSPASGPANRGGETATSGDLGRSGGGKPTAAPSPTPSSAATGSCPNPRYCADYINTPATWPTDNTGHAVIHYSVNPGPPPSTDLSATQIVTIVQRAAQTWMAADSVIQLIYDGTTNQQPEGFNNVVGFVPGPWTANTQVGTDPGTSTASGFDIQLDTGPYWTWQPCNPAAGHPCSPYTHSGSNLYDLEQILAHEWGHVVGDSDVGDSQRDYLLTEYGASYNGPDCGTNGPVCRFADTLGLGDILGVRHQYPTAEPMPVLYDDQ